MSSLIKITTNEEDGTQLVSAKELYLGLGLNKSNWARWYPANIEKNDFFEKNVDWVGVRHTDEGNGTMDFAITLDFAKHIAMMARTSKSHEYRNYFIECEKKIKEQHKPQCIEDVLIQSLQEMKDIKQQLNQVNHNALEANKRAEETKEEVQAIRDVVALNPNDWRKDTSSLINKMALSVGGYEHIKLLREESYRLLEQRMGVQLSTRLTNKRRRMADEGVCKSKRDKLNKVDVIADDKKLIEGYIAIVKEMAIKYKVA
ncbi:antA/AntB antirepressor family protein [Clostridium sp. MB40-C1]|uniref:antA/AntB antirepressor family protein n=1 Tax=Clostridium sp. MB40-C1 TaxID=3070996 RepID=UPI0027E097FA|nr:antA/AntB antirepressor family protein [Clostridium sp. MB40-C1]WMJ79569.1 antA/AntB antirepressor family protein [Clostridium sp. MB40-C1]